LRGSQKNIFRLYGFDKPSLVHMLFFRILIFVSLITVIAAVAYILLQTPLSFLVLKALLLAVWILFAPQLYAVVKVLALVMTTGRASKTMNESFLNSLHKSERPSVAFRILPYAALALWLILFLIAVWKWF
jgi:hypothetical protein